VVVGHYCPTTDGQLGSSEQADADCPEIEYVRRAEAFTAKLTHIAYGHITVYIPIMITFQCSDFSVFTNHIVIMFNACGPGVA
jgi:hypothetical protein